MSLVEGVILDQFLGDFKAIKVHELSKDIHFYFVKRILEGEGEDVLYSKLLED